MIVDKTNKRVIREGGLEYMLQLIRCGDNSSKYK